MPTAQTDGNELLVVDRNRLEVEVLGAVKTLSLREDATEDTSNVLGGTTHARQKSGLVWHITCALLVASHFLGNAQTLTKSRTVVNLTSLHFDKSPRLSEDEHRDDCVVLLCWLFANVAVKLAAYRP